MRLKKIGILTGGGDCPGLNAVIRAAVRRAQAFDLEVLGIRNGWPGLAVPLSEATAGRKTVGLEHYADAEVFFG